MNKTILNIALLATAIVISGCFAQAESIEDQPQVDIAAKHYKVESIKCKQMCFAKVKADEYDIFVEFRFDDASVDGTNILNVVRFDETVNAHIDYYEIEKINAAIAGGVK